MCALWNCNEQTITEHSTTGSSISLSNIESKQNIEPIIVEKLDKNAGYYSYYFVFVAADEPLIIPFDFNWSPTKKGYNYEFKAWYGTEQDWPILYLNGDKKSKTIPQAPWEHKDTGGFQFDKKARTISIKIEKSPKLTLIIPEKSEWIPMQRQSNNKEIYAFQTSVKRNNELINGWMIYERIRWDAASVKSFGDFSAFYWIPLVIDGDFYHFELHEGHGEQTATKWYVADTTIKTEITNDFTVDVLEIVPDTKSGRKEIPKVIQVQAPTWGIDISLSSEGAQVGYGGQFPKGLAYYRQSILKKTNYSKTDGYGMLELILENN